MIYGEKKMSKILKWNNVDRDRWAYHFEEKRCSMIIYKLTKLPDFTEQRFSYLAKEADNRAAEVAKKQQQMLRQLHGLGEHWAISMRLVKKQDIMLYLVFRYAGGHFLSEAERKGANLKIQNALLRSEYSFEMITDGSKTECFDLSWANEAAEITKEEKEFEGDTPPVGSPQKFYTSFTWTAVDNRMEYLCNALMNHQGTAVAEVTVSPTKYLEEERDWINLSVRYLKECMNGETYRDQNGKKIWEGKKLPMLQTPADNYQKMNRQYEMSRIFLSSIRVYADNGAEAIAGAFLANSVKNDGTIQIFRKGFGKYSYLVQCYQNVDISADVHSPYWNRHTQMVPRRAQRLNRLNSLEEISNFFRIPIPIKKGFPGFRLDTGLQDFSSRKKAKSIIKLGNYLDIAGRTDEPAQFDSQQLAKHGLIVGVPGSGKTTAMFNILYQLWGVPDEQKIPFIILEPAKTEYRALKQLPVFREDMLVFTLGDESVSPFRFNPMEVLPGIKIESHISRLQACFTGAFDLFDPLPIFLEQAIRRTYLEKGWYEDSRGGEEGLETPTLTDLCRNAEYIVENSGFDSKMRSDFKASLLERLNSLRRGSKGRMLDTPHSIPMEELMGRPVVLELDSLNGDEKSLMMMFLLSYVYEYCKVKRKSGSPLKHMLLVEEAHNLISSQGGGSDSRANPKAQTIELFVNMLAEMRALGQGILIADQLPTAIAPQAVKQTNVKILMRVTAKDDREEIGNTMDLNEEQMHQVVNFKTGHAYIYHEGEDRVRTIRMVNFKGEHEVEEPPEDEELKGIMADYERSHRELYLPFPQCSGACDLCNRRVRNQAENFVQRLLLDNYADPYAQVFRLSDKKQLEAFRKTLGLCGICMRSAKNEADRIQKRYGHLGESFGKCVYIHMLNLCGEKMRNCGIRGKKCSCGEDKRKEYLEKFGQIGEE